MFDWFERLVPIIRHRRGYGFCLQQIHDHLLFLFPDMPEEAFFLCYKSAGILDSDACD